MVNPKLQTLFDGVIQVPTLPQVVTRLINIIDDPNTSATEVSKLIASDQSFMFKILKLVNSPFYGMSRQISTLTQATVILGFSVIRNLAISTAIFDEFAGDKSNSAQLNFTREKFWEHSIGCAIAAKSISPYTNHPDPEDAFIAGLIHDIGKVILDQFVHEEFVEALILAEARSSSIFEAEVEIFGKSHAEIGGWIAEKWHLPDPLICAIKYHHDPVPHLNDSVLPAIINLANYISRKHNYGASGDSIDAELDPTILPALSLSEMDLEVIEETVEQNYEKAVEFFRSAIG